MQSGRHARCLKLWLQVVWVNCNCNFCTCGRRKPLSLKVRTYQLCPPPWETLCNLLTDVDFLELFTFLKKNARSHFGHRAFWVHSPSPCKKINPVTTKTGCQLNSVSPPSQAKPSLKCRTHLSTKMIETSPAAAAALRTATNCLKFSIATQGRRLGLTVRLVAE